jgi:trans-AT polyketide synthase/acyltransferase/oxidoreductase domain-containing protein
MNHERRTKPPPPGFPAELTVGPNSAANPTARSGGLPGAAGPPDGRDPCLFVPLSHPLSPIRGRAPPPPCLAEVIMEATVLEPEVESRRTAAPASRPGERPEERLARRLGSEHFRREYGVKYAYATGAMYRGIASKEMVVAMGRAGLMGFLGTGGLSPDRIRADIAFIQRELGPQQAYGMNLIANVGSPETEMKTAELYIETGVRTIEASAFMQITPALVRYRLSGLRQLADGPVECRHRIVAKISRPEVAKGFMGPAPERIVAKLLADGLVTPEQARLAASVPMASDICVEADSGGHTDQGVALVLLARMQRLRQECGHDERAMRVGLAGGIGTPEAVAAAFVMGADFVVTGSINQCTVEAATSDVVKDMLQDIDIQDTAYAPAGDMFELGAKVQVMKKGVFFPARANRLAALYQQYESLDDLPAAVREQLEEKYFRKSLASIWTETRSFFESSGQLGEIEKAERSPKHKMALVFRWYFGHSMRAAFNGDEKHRVDYQIHTGPALGAFNRWVKGTPWENWRARHVDQMGERLMVEAGKVLAQRLEALSLPAAR